MKYDIFISYRRADREVVAGVARRLEARSLTVWYDANVEGGSDWGVVSKALEESALLAVFFSEDGNASKQLKNELAAADEAGKPVAPILLEDTRPRGAYLYDLADRCWIQAWPDPMGRLDEIADLLAKLAAKDQGVKVVAANEATPEAANEAVPMAANDSGGPVRADFVGKVGAAGRKIPKNDLMPFRLIDLVAILPWLGFCVWRWWDLGPPQAITVSTTWFMLGVAAFGTLLFPVRYFLRGRSVASALRSHLISTAIPLLLALGAHVAGKLFEGGLQPANLGRDVLQVVGPWLVFTLIAFLIYGALSAQRMLKRFKSNIRKI